MSINIGETKELNHTNKPNSLNEVLKRLDDIEKKIDNLSIDGNGKIDKTMSYVKSSVSQIQNTIYTRTDEHMKKITLRIFQVTGTIIICLPAIVAIIWSLILLIKFFK